MWRWPLRSALYIDFENVPLPPDAIAKWLAWLEDGLFDAQGRRRRFLQKRVYWNSHAERHRELFESHGFSVVLVGKFSGLKNGADIRMAMDVVEATYTRSEIDEYILLTSDSDFVPVLVRLREKGKRSAIVATEHRPNIHTTYGLYADALIPSRRLPEAAQYVRRKRGLLAGWRRTGATESIATRPNAGRQDKPSGQPGSLSPSAAIRPRARVTAPPTDARPTNGPATDARAADARPTDTPSSETANQLDVALQCVVKLMSQQANNFMAQKRVMAELDRVQGFKRQGPLAYLGFASYVELMRELARRDPRIKVVEQPSGGMGVVFRPGLPSTTPRPAKAQAEGTQAESADGVSENAVSAVTEGPQAPPRLSGTAPAAAMPRDSGHAANVGARPLPDDGGGIVGDAAVQPHVGANGVGTNGAGANGVVAPDVSAAVASGPTRDPSRWLPRTAEEAGVAGVPKPRPSDCTLRPQPPSPPQLERSLEQQTESGG